MKLRILKGFYDKYTNVLYKKGDIVDFKTDRAKELLSNDLNIVKSEDDEILASKKTKRRIKKDE